ncbi:MAG: ADOP family duplicated permease, partial [Holophagales bacterium]|nr:ADOP family duplicated permease [Holophagales bacterium]
MPGSTALSTLRALARRPRFTVAAVLTLAMGIGAATAVFTLADSVLLRPLPYPEAHRLVGFWAQGSWSMAELDFVRENTRSYEAVGAYTTAEIPFAGEHPRVLRAAVASPELIAALGVPAAHGRLFHDREEVPGHGRGVLVSHRFWSTELGADPRAVGRSLRLTDSTYEVVGVMPEGFSFPTPGIDLWVPLAVDPTSGSYRGHYYLGLAGKLRPGVSVTTAHEEIRALVPALQETFDLEPGFDKLAIPAAVETLREQVSRSARVPLQVLLAASSLLLLIACANVAHLLLAQALRRQREMAIRGALGADRGQLLAQLLGESVGIALAGGALGLLIATWTLDVVRLQLPAETPGLAQLFVDSRMLLFGLLTSLLTVALFGLLPAFRGSRADLRHTLGEGTAGSGSGPGSHRLRRGLVAAEMALAALLSITAVSTIRSFVALSTQDPGFEAGGVITLRPEPAGDGWQERQAVLTYFEQAVETLESVPGVSSASAIWRLPIAERGAYQVLEVEGHEPAPGESLSVYWRAIAGDYFSTLGIPLVAGTGVAGRHGAEDPQVGWVSQTMADAFWPGGDAVGKRIRNSMDGDAWVTIVGVVGDVRHEGLRRSAGFTLYRPLAQSPPWVSRMALVARAEGSPSAALSGARAALTELAPTVPIHREMGLEEVLRGDVARERLTGAVTGVYGLLALTLAAVGVFGLLSFTVAERRR